jgi:diguanylate cyclase (GGDEF)-like protein/PAS domain S-box-containing protein
MNANTQMQRTSIVLICPNNDKGTTVVSDPFILAMIGQLGDVLSKRNSDLLIATYPPGKYNWKQIFIGSGRAQGVVVIGENEFKESIDILVRQHVPLVVWGMTSSLAKHCAVGSDNHHGGYLATKHLLEAGRRRIVFLGDRHYPEIHECYLGYVKALKEFNCSYDENMVVKTYPHSFSTFEVINNDLIKKNIEFDAIFASSDLVAMDAILILKKLGLVVPEDVSVVGFGNAPVAMLSDPSLTTVAQDINFAAREIIARLFALINKQKIKSLRLPVKLIIRGSCTPKTEARGIIILDHNGVIEHFDSATEKILGYSVQELFGKDIRYLLPDPALIEGNYSVDLKISDFANVANRGLVRFMHMEHKRGEVIPVELSITCREENGLNKFTCVIWNASGIVTDDETGLDSEQYQNVLELAVAERTKELTKEAAKLQQLALEDPLTGVANRRQFDARLQFELINAQKSGQPISLAMFDVDSFKAYNDNYGHQAGDGCLRNIAKLLENSFNRSTDMVARYGGEEFAVILPYTGSTDAKALVERALHNVFSASIPHAFSSAADVVTVSCGLFSAAPADAINVCQLIWGADKALYEAKAAGRNRLVWNFGD